MILRVTLLLLGLGLMPVQAGGDANECGPGTCLMTREQIGDELLALIRLLNQENYYLRHRSCSSYLES